MAVLISNWTYVSITSNSLALNQHLMWLKCGWGPWFWWVADPPKLGSYRTKEYTPCPSHAPLNLHCPSLASITFLILGPVATWGERHTSSTLMVQKFFSALSQYSRASTRYCTTAKVQFVFTLDLFALHPNWKWQNLLNLSPWGRREGNTFQCSDLQPHAMHADGPSFNIGQKIEQFGKILTEKLRKSSQVFNTTTKYWLLIEKWPHSEPLP